MKESQDAANEGISAGKLGISRCGKDAVRREKMDLKRDQENFTGAGGSWTKSAVTEKPLSD